MIGRTISHYKVTAELGRGGMGVVYKAEDTKLERPVALKFLAEHAIEDPEHKARFVREAKAAARLDHQNICPIYEIDEVDGQMFLAMAYLEGQTLKDKIAERPLKLDEALDIAIQTAQGLKAAHQKEIVHRDIKPANLMLIEDGPVKIMDFGLAQLAEQSRLTKTATMLGTPAYMSPEQSQRLPTDRRTDIWSLGVVIYEMVTGRLPFEGARQEAILYAIGGEDPEPITALRAGLPMDLEWIVGKAMAKDAAERYQHVEEMLVDLNSLSKKLALTNEQRQTTLTPGTPDSGATYRFPARLSPGFPLLPTNPDRHATHYSCTPRVNLNLSGPNTSIAKSTSSPDRSETVTARPKSSLETPSALHATSHTGINRQAVFSLIDNHIQSPKPTKTAVAANIGLADSLDPNRPNSSVVMPRRLAAIVTIPTMVVMNKIPNMLAMPDDSLRTITPELCTAGCN